MSSVPALDGRSPRSRAKSHRKCNGGWPPRARHLSSPSVESFSSSSNNSTAPKAPSTAARNAVSRLPPSRRFESETVFLSALYAAQLIRKLTASLGKTPTLETRARSRERSASRGFSIFAFFGESDLDSRIDSGSHHPGTVSVTVRSPSASLVSVLLPVLTLSPDDLGTFPLLFSFSKSGLIEKARSRTFTSKLANSDSRLSRGPRFFRLTPSFEDPKAASIDGTVPPPRESSLLSSLVVVFSSENAERSRTMIAISILLAS